MVPIPAWPDLPLMQHSAQELLTDLESGRIAGGGVYAHFAVPASVDRVYALLADDAKMSTWIPHLSRSEILEQQGTCNRVAYTVPSPIGDVGYELWRCHDGQRIWWTRAGGERFTRLDGSYTLEAMEGGTLVHYWSAVEASIPVALSIQEEVARLGLGGLVDAMRKAL